MRPRPSRFISPSAAIIPRDCHMPLPSSWRKARPARQRIRAASLVASRFDRRHNPSRGFRSSAPSTESLSVSNSPPRRSRPTL
jgi:hypothetical protein